MMSTTMRDAPILMLFIATMKPTEPRSSSFVLAVAKRERPAIVFERISCSMLAASATRSAPGGVCPGLRRASARTKDWARETALEAMPYHTALQRMWQIASIDLAAISPKSFGRICATSPSAENLKLSEQVPRMPIASHTPVSSSLY